MRRRKKVDLYYGSRKSDKLVRCYKKREVGAYRVEPELHSGLLRRYGIIELDDVVRLPDVLCPKQLQFVDFNWNQLARHLAKKIIPNQTSGIALCICKSKTTRQEPFIPFDSSSVKAS